VYPDPADWTSRDANGAWFYDLARDTVCQTNGWNFLYTVESDIALFLSTPLPTFDGSMVDASAVSIIDPSVPSAGAWSLNLLRALYAVALHFNAPQGYLQAIANDANSQTISAGTLATAAWMEMGRTVYSDGSPTLTGSPDDVRIPSGAMLPTWGVPPPQPAQISAGFDCARPIPQGAAIPESPIVVPFQMDVILVLVVIGVVVVGSSLMANKIPVRRISNPRRRRRK
jgi:hypothetical protein